MESEQPKVKLFEDFYDLKTEKEIFHGLTTLFRHVDRLMRDGYFGKLNKCFLNVEVERLSIELRVGILRITSSAKHLIPSWYSLRDKVNESLKGNERRKRILVGLLD